MRRRPVSGCAPAASTGQAGQPHAGVVTCAGLTNVGKSTLINRLLGQKLVIVSPKPQTTSRRLRGIVNAPGGQFVIVDTPGLHRANKALNRSLLREARAGLVGADAILAVSAPPASGAPAADDLLRAFVREARLPAILALNKVDLIAPREAGRIVEQERESGAWSQVIEVSARTGRNLAALTSAVLAVLPAGQPSHPEDLLSDQPERAFFAELIRERIFNALHQELPYSAAVVIEEVLEEAQPRRYRIHATLFVERESQKAIVIGEGGKTLRVIGEGARRAIEEFTGAPVYLGLWVKVRRNWTKDERALREFGFGP